MEVDLPDTSYRLHHVEDLWFDDGDIVLQAGVAQYRVYRVVLGMHSPVFKDMLAFPQPPDSELVEGQPLVVLQDLEVEVTAFLRALFEPEFFPAFPAMTNFTTIYGCIRLGNKYSVDFLLRRGLVHLSSRFMTSLTRFDASARGDHEGLYTPEFTEQKPANEIVSWKPPLDRSFLICVIALAREVDALWILPNAFYDLTFHFDALQDNIFHENLFDGVIPVVLSRKEQREWVVGFEDQISTTADIVRFLTYPPVIDGCLTPSKCPLVRFRAADYGRQMISSFSRGPLSAWAEDDWDKLQKLCPVCMKKLRELHQEARRTFWEDLPDIYRLPPWTELLKLKQAVIGDILA
ncbi:BTB domain-containing protein [Mycena indigotica]|uniref:BTB domain-containing protein n=1 Tax=Mycena indigotica TaxID=2126181 RepID=A0A8H6WFN7_9AGAR|nr:BTB domain-containing protein [Mycena indigotica]KAF7314941.1 BTB domain-containing protein [Mycena indigotica]